MKQSGEKNLLLQNEDDNYEEDYNQRTPKVLSSEEDEEVLIGTGRNIEKLGGI